MKSENHGQINHTSNKHKEGKKMLQLTDLCQFEG